MMDERTGYIKLFNFLDRIWEQNKSHYDFTLPSLLGSMQILVDGSSADAAQQYDWHDLWGNKQSLDVWEIYQLGHQFVERYRDEEIANLLDNWHEDKYRNLWLKVIESDENRSNSTIGYNPENGE